MFDNMTALDSCSVVLEGKMKELHEYIYIRKSSRKYMMEELDSQTMEEIRAFADNLKPLHEGIRVHHKIVSDTKNLLPIKAPHYFLIYSEQKEGYLYNVGFLYQQLDLYLSSRGLGSCWLGMAKPKEKEDVSDDYVIALGFGKTPYPPHRDPEAFMRKPADEVSKGQDERIDAAMLAPSASNSQNWFFEASEGRVHVYEKKLTPLEKLMYSKMSKIDIGIALAHIYVTSEKLGKEFRFEKVVPGPTLKGLNYVGTVL